LLRQPFILICDRSLLPQVCQFGNVTCGGFTALNDRGYLQVSLQNAGAIAASFTVTVRPTSWQVPAQEALYPL
jgi:hypothetical protein